MMKAYLPIHLCFKICLWNIGKEKLCNTCFEIIINGLLSADNDVKLSLTLFSLLHNVSGRMCLLRGTIVSEPNSVIVTASRERNKTKSESGGHNYGNATGNKIYY